MWEIRHATEPAKFSDRAIKASWWLGTASLAFGLFIKITSELLEHEVSGVDRTILIGFAKARTPWLTVVAVDLTACAMLDRRHVQPARAQRRQWHRQQNQY